jgi:REP element-mobilizing transposase RayT
MISLKWQELLYKATAARVAELGGKALAVGGTPDHLHLVAAAPAQIAVSRFIAEVKHATARFVNNQVCPPFLFAWQNDYGITTLDPGSLDQIIQYVHAQADHHCAGSTIASLEQDGLLNWSAA